MRNLNDLELPDPAPRPAAPRRSTARAIYRGFTDLLKTLTLALIVFVLARTLVLPYEVEGASMAPNLLDQERVLVNRTVYFHFDLNRVLNLLPGEDTTDTREFYPFHGPERGDIVVLQPPFASSKPYIKRVIGLPGEAIAFHDGYVYIDGERLDETYLDGPITECDGGRFCAIGVIPDDSVYVLGDNRENSSDSRAFGPVKISDIVGKAWFTNWPLDSLGPVPHYDYGD